MRINRNGMVIEFNGSHTATVTMPNGSLDVFTFAFEKNRATALDFLEATRNWLEDYS